MCVICVQKIADAQERLNHPSISVEDREILCRNVQNYESFIQTDQQTIGRIDADLIVRRLALQGERAIDQPHYLAAECCSASQCIGQPHWRDT